MFRAGTDFTLAQCALACKQALTASRKRVYDDPSFHKEVTVDSQAYEGMLEVIAVLGDCTGVDNAQECFHCFKQKLEEVDEDLAAVTFASSDKCVLRKPTAAAASGSDGSNSPSYDPSGPPDQIPPEKWARITENRARAMAIKRQRKAAAEAAQSSRAEVLCPPFD